MDFLDELDEFAAEVMQQSKRERQYFEDSNDSFDDSSSNKDFDPSDFDPRNRLREMKNVDRCHLIQCKFNSEETIPFKTLKRSKILKEKKEVNGICHLVESHAAFLRQQVINRSSKKKIKQTLLNEDSFSMDCTYVNFNFNEDVWNGKVLRSYLKELPEDWYIIQVTTRYKSFSYVPTSLNLPLSQHIRETESLHISILPTGKEGYDPMCITLPKPKHSEIYDIMKEIGTVIYYLKSDLKRHYEHGKMYWNMREKQNNKMKLAVEEIEKSWLKEWRVLFVADFAENSKLVHNLSQELDQLIRGHSKYKEITPRQKWLLKKITFGASYLNKLEIAKAAKYVLLDHIELAKKFVQFVNENMEQVKFMQRLKRKNLILIVDEVIDHIPFEMINVLKNQPVARMPCLSIAYTLYKEFEDSIEDGCKVIEVNQDNLGTFIVNPAGDLAGTEKRLKVFNDYWLKDWNGTYGVEPDAKKFENMLIDYNILLYNGHGSGMEYLSGYQIEQIRVKANAFLFGCGSASLSPTGGQYPLFGISNHYLMGHSPCVLGMLWIVTDTDVDRLTVHFLSQWLKSNAKWPWSNVDQKMWMKGELVFKEPAEKSSKTFEPEMLRAVASSRGVCEHYITSAAVVIRGLPIKLVYK